MVKLKINKLTGFLFMLIFIGAIAYLSSYTIILAKAGLHDPQIANMLDFFEMLAIGGVFFLAVIYVFNHFWKQDDRYGSNIGIFSKEETIFKDFTYPQLALLSTIVFSIFFFIANLINSKSLTGLNVLPQQFSPTDSLVFSSLLTPTAENLLFAFAIALILILLRFIAVKTNMKKTDFKMWSYLVAILGGSAFGIMWHQSAYPGSDIAIVIVGIFWGIMGLLAYATGFFIVPLIFHQLNNFFIDFARLFASTVVQTFMTISILSMIGFYLWKYQGRLFPFRGEL